MTTAKSAPSLEERLRAFALLSQCQAQLAHELSLELPRAVRAGARRKSRRPNPPTKTNT